MQKLTVVLISIAVAAGLVALNYFKETETFSVDSKAGYNSFKTEFRKTANTLMKKYEIPGCAIALIRKGKTVFVKGYGWADKDKKIKIDNKTEFQIASNSKTITAWGAMKLVQAGKLDLDKPIESYFSGWRIPKSKFDSAGVTLRRLLSHTSGIIKGSYAGYDPREKLPTLEQSLSGEAKGVKKLALVSKPGSKYAYSGYNYTLIQMIIEETAGESFSKYMQEEVLKPLGMPDSSFDASSLILKKASKAYGITGKAMPNFVYTEKAAAGMYTTIEDFARFVEANINTLDKEDTENSVLSKASLKKMLVPVKKDYGLGYIIQKLPDKSRLVYHGGANRGWRSQFAFLPEKGDGMVVLTNSENGENMHRDLMDIFTKWETGYWTKYHIWNITGRIAVQTAGQAIILIMLTTVICLIRDIIRGKRKFILYWKNWDIRTIGKILLVSILLIGFSALWQVVFYTGLIYNGWTFASFMPYGFYWLTAAVIMGCMVLTVRLLFLKCSHHNFYRKKASKLDDLGGR